MLETELDNRERDNRDPAGSGNAAVSGEPPVVPGVQAASEQPPVAAPGSAAQPSAVQLSAAQPPAAQPPDPPVHAAALAPAASFQPPQAIFQPPAVAPAVTGNDEDAAGDEPDADSDGAGGGRRRRRRGGRGRGKGGDGGDGGDGGIGGIGGVVHDAADIGIETPAAAGAGAPPAAPRPARPRKRGGANRDREGSAPDDADEETDTPDVPPSGTAVGEAMGGTGRTRRATAARTQDTKGPSAQSTSGQSRSAQSSAQADASGSERDDESDAGGDGESAASRRRRRRRRRGSGGDAEPVGTDDPPNTVVHVREPRAATAPDWDEVQSVKGSTRLEAKKQRRREGRESGRRRPPVLSESEFLARREAVQRVMLVRQKGERIQIAVLEDGVLVEHYVDRATHQSMAGNIYFGKVQNVLPSMEAAFVDIGKGRNAVLYAGEINFDASGLEGQPKRIEMVLKSGQSVLVQVTKDPVGHKGARLTNQVSLPGRYLVYVPGASMTGISRKLPVTERTRLKQILRKVTPENAGVIVRTAAEGTGEEELSRDVARLAAQWENIERKAASATPPELLYSEPDLTIRVVRDIFNEDFGELVVAGDDGWDTVNEYVRYVAPHLAGRLRRWQDDADVFASYRIDEQLAKALERKVWLPSGGSLVIDRTEAMTVIDVNTGKFTGQGGNLEETVTRNNLEAAEEIVRELRLRDIGGIIVVDFIDMVLESNRELVLRRLLECLARDRTKHQVAEVTSLGLVQMTRKRVGSGLLEAFSEPCECCNGRGVHVSMDLLDAPSGKPTQVGRGGGRGEAKGQGDGRGQGDDKGPSGFRWQPAKAQDDSRGQGETGGQMRASGDENGRGRGAGSVVTGAGDSAGARGGGGAIAEGPRGSAAPEEKPSGRRRRRKQAAPDGDGGSTVAPAVGAGTLAAGRVPAGADAVSTPASEAAAAGYSGTVRDTGSPGTAHTDARQMGTWYSDQMGSEHTGSDHTGTQRPGAGFAGSEQMGAGFAGSEQVGSEFTGGEQVGSGSVGSEHPGTRHLDTRPTGTGHTDTAVAATGPDDDVTAAGVTATAEAGSAPPSASAAVAAPAAPPAGPAQAGPAQAGPAQAGPAQAGPAQAGPAQAGPAQAGPAQAGPAPAAPPPSMPTT